MSLAEEVQSARLLDVPGVTNGQERGLVLPVARVTTLAAAGALCRVESSDTTRCGWVEPDSPAGLPPAVVAWLETIEGERFRFPDALVPWARLVISAGITVVGKVEFRHLASGRMSAEFRR